MQLETSGEAEVGEPVVNSDLGLSEWSKRLGSEGFRAKSVVSTQNKPKCASPKSLL
jgi:hypothetical protein